MHGKAPEQPLGVHAHELTLYTDEYKQRAPKAEAFRGSLSTWNRFAAAKPLLYLPARSLNPDFDARDRRRHLWTHKELDGFGDGVETRTQELLEAQERLLKAWHGAATQVEKVVRGFLVRQRVKRLLDAIANAANQLERAKLLMWLLKKQVAAALLVQKAYRRHVAYLAYVEKCRSRLQRSTRLFLFRLQRLCATRTLQRAFRCYRYRRCVLLHLHQLCKALHAARQRRRLDQLALVFHHTREQSLRQQQELLWERHPDKMAQLQRVQQRKGEVNAVVLPLLGAGRQQQKTRSKVCGNAKQSRGEPLRTSLNQVPSLPALQHKTLSFPPATPPRRACPMPRKTAAKVPIAAAVESQAQPSTGVVTRSIAVSEPAQRVQRERKARIVYSPATPVRNRAGKRAPATAAAAPKGNSPVALKMKSQVRPAKTSKDRSTTETPEKKQLLLQEQSTSDDAEKSSAESGTPEYKKLEGRVKGQVKRLRYHLAFVEAYEAEGWRRASREKLKPSKELENANAKILKDKRAVLATLAELQRVNAQDKQYPHLAAAATGEQLLLPEDIYCSRCGSTDADEDNDILICDSDGCQRAYHQKCQRPWLKTEDIPVGDEHWYCEVCLAVFNSLKLINSAFGTTYDTVGELFPELDEEEKQRGGSGVGGGYEGEEDEEEDEDFVVDVESDDDESELSDGESEESDAAEDDEAPSRHPAEGDDELLLDADEISDQELKYLRTTDVIDPNSRSMRSNSKQSKKSPPSRDFLGQRAAKVVEDAATGAVVFGVIVDEFEELEQWQVVYYNDTMELLSRDQVLAAIALAKAHEHTHAAPTPGGEMDGVTGDPKLILHGKRKRTQVNYRELNDAMFAGKADSDEEAEDPAGVGTGAGSGAYVDEEEEDEDYDPEEEEKKLSKASKHDEPVDAGDDDANATSKRSRRERKSVDYHALNEGLLSY